MLEQKKDLKLENGAILGFKLSTGEEILGRIKSVERADVILEMPHTIMISQQGAALSPWPMIGQDGADIGISRNSIVSFFRVRDDFNEYYTEILKGEVEEDAQEETNPGIIMPSEKKIIT